MTLTLRTTPFCQSVFPSNGAKRHLPSKIQVAFSPTQIVDEDEKGACKAAN